MSTLIGVDPDITHRAAVDGRVAGRMYYDVTGKTQEKIAKRIEEQKVGQKNNY